LKAIATLRLFWFFCHMSSKAIYVAFDDICFSNIWRRLCHSRFWRDMSEKPYVVKNDICRFWRHMHFRHMALTST